MTNSHAVTAILTTELRVPELLREGGERYAANRLPYSGKPKLLDQVRSAIRSRHYSQSTEKTYVHWIRRFILFHGKCHPIDMGEAEVSRFLNHLAEERRVSASTQNQALSAILFLYRHVLGRELEWLDDLVRAKPSERVRVVLTREEVRALLRQMSGTPRMMAYLLYGAGLRLMECVRLRVKDVDFARHEITVRQGKGRKDRRTMLPDRVRRVLRDHLAEVRRQHEADLKLNAGSVELPYAIGRKYPNAHQEWGWQWVFPATRIYHDRETGQHRRHHLHQSVLQKAIKRAVSEAGIVKPATSHIPCATPSPPTFSKGDTTSGQSRNF